MLSKLPDDSDPKRVEAEEMVKAVAAAAYGGKSTSELLRLRLKLTVEQGGSESVSA